MKIKATIDTPPVTRAPYPNTVTALYLRKLAELLENDALPPINLYEDGRLVGRLEIMPEDDPSDACRVHTFVAL